MITTMDEHSTVSEWTTSATFFGPENCPIATMYVGGGGSGGGGGGGGVGGEVEGGWGGGERGEVGGGMPEEVHVQ